MAALTYPKWKYRKHPDIGCFQSTLVLNADAEKELGDTWSDDPASTGFKVRLATQMHHSHAGAKNVLHEPVTDAKGAPVAADIASLTSGDIHG